MKRLMYISVFLVAIVLGLLVTFQFRATSRIAQGVPAGRDQEMAIELSRLEAEKSDSQREINDLNDKLLQATKGQKEALSALRGELTKARVAAGLVAVTGPGIEIILDNPQVMPQTGKASTLFTIRDEDLLRVINELRIAGAEALSINGQRIVATTEIRLAAPFINVNLTRIVPPYHILVIGNPDNLKATMDISGGVVEYLRELGARVEIQTNDQLTAPSYSSGRQ
ncbi:MAG TPA: hypothetical protein DCM26_02240 [Desulfotomaculum sp.]|nr:hypothetical protein [Desulfotomaculum sp.]